MYTVTELCRLTGVSPRTLRHYDAIGLLVADRCPENGYRLYRQSHLERLQLILFFRELQFPLKAIGPLLDAPDFDRTRALQQQAELLTLKKKHLENLITLATYAGCTGVKHMKLTQQDYQKLDDYAAQAKTLWQETPAYQEYLQKAKGRTQQQEADLGEGLMAIFDRLGEIRTADPADPRAQELVETLRSYITQHFYNCTPTILRSLGQMYAGGGSFTETIDGRCGAGTALFAQQAIESYCKTAP